LGLFQPVSIIPNGFNFKVNQQKTNKKLFSKPNTTFLFLGRIHPKKGLINLLSALAMIKTSNWKLVIAGPDDNCYLKKIFKKASSLGLENFIEYIGEVKSKEKENLFINSDFLVLPSFSENFGNVVVEALSYGLPVIATHGTPWQDLEKYKCGWWVENGATYILKALEDAINLSYKEKIAMSDRAKEYIKRYDIKITSIKFLATIEWVVGKKPKPECAIIK
jgi:glycosyltransferase involved in cell wall biosynthesis